MLIKWLTGTSIHGIFQARVLEWVAIAFSERANYSERGSHLPEVTQLGRDKAGLYTKTGACMREEEQEPSNKGIPAPGPLKMHQE